MTFRLSVPPLSRHVACASHGNRHGVPRSQAHGTRTCTAAFHLFLVWFASCYGQPGTEWQLSAEVDRVVYLPGAPGSVSVTVRSPLNHDAALLLKGHLEYGMTALAGLADIPLTIKAGAQRTLTIPFRAPVDAWGARVAFRLCSQDTVLTRAHDVFAVGTNNYRLGQQSSHGGALAGHRLKQFEGADSYYANQWRNMKGTWLETFGALPSEFCGLTTEWDEWITMQGRYRTSRRTLRAYTDTAHRLGMKVMIYNNAAPSGWIGTAWAREHPQWLSYDYMGQMRADLSVLDVEKQKAWHKTLKPHQTSAFHPLYLNFAHHPELVEFGCEQMLQACRDFGYDGVRFDGHWIIGDVWSGLGYGMDGRRPNRGGSLDQLSAGILRHMKQYTWEREADFLFGYNYGQHYATGGARNPGAYREACANGGMILWEGCTFDDAYADLCVGAMKLRENALRVHQNGGIHYGQAQMMHAGDLFSLNAFSLRCFFIANFAATSHIYAGVYADHPSYHPIQGTYFRFALRYGELLYDPALRPLAVPTDQLTVSVAGQRNPDLWWQPYTYKRPLDGRYQLITHLVNMPVPGVTKKNSTPDKQPAPLESVRITLKQQPRRVFLLDAEASEWQTDLGSVQDITIDALNAWKVLVQEFDGTCDHIPTEVIPEGDLKGRDTLPDSRDGRIVLPVNYLITGAGAGGGYYATDVAGARLVSDNEAMFGFALHCDADTVSRPTQVMFGPHHSMPIAAPGRTRVTFRLKLADNSSAETIGTLTGRFGKRAIKANAFEQPNVYQEFAFDYDVTEGRSNYVAMEYHGVADLWIDSVVMEQPAPAHDRDLLPASTPDVSGPSPRSGVTKRAHLLRGLWHDYFGLDDALKRAGIEVTESWESLSTDHADIPSAFPVTVAELLEYDIVALLNAGAGSLQPVRRKNLQEYVRRGGSLFVGGGTRAFGHGGYPNTLLADILPVDIRRFDLREAVGPGQVITPCIDNDITTGISFAEEPRNHFYHAVEAKSGATILLASGEEPILTVGAVGHGTVYAMTGTPLGNIEDGTPWWESVTWRHVLDRIVTKASPGSERTMRAGQSSDLTLLGRITGTADLALVDGAGTIVAPTASANVTATADGIDFGYDGGKAPAGTLVYPSGLIMPYGSIAFEITPGWKTSLADIDRSATLFYTRSEAGDSFQIYIFVYPHTTGDVSVALACYIRTRDAGATEASDHFARYALMPISRGGLRHLKYTPWRKGETHRVKVRWSPSQVVLWDNGERMAASDFAPPIDMGGFAGPLLVGCDSAGRLARVRMRDIVIRGSR